MRNPERLSVDVCRRLRISNPPRHLKNLPFIALLAGLPLAACAAPYQDNGDTTLREIQGLYQPQNPEVFEEQLQYDSPPRSQSSELNSYRSSPYRTKSDPDWHGSITFPFGIQVVDDLGDVDELANVGFFDLALQPPGSPISFVVQALGSFSSDVPQEDLGLPFDDADTTFISQFNLGLRYVWRNGPVQPYLGVGTSFIDSNVLEDRNSFGNDEIDSDSDFAGWVGTGLNFTSPSGFLVGVNVQYLFGAEAELLGETFDLDGITAGFVIGYGF